MFYWIMFFSFVAYSLSVIHNVNFRFITGFPKNLIWTRLWQGLDKTWTSLLKSVKMLIKWRFSETLKRKRVGQVDFLIIYLTLTGVSISVSYFHKMWLGIYSILAGWLSKMISASFNNLKCLSTFVLVWLGWKPNLVDTSSILINRAVL